MIVDDRAEVSGQRLAFTRGLEERTRREVDHPQLVNQGHFESLGRAAQTLAQEITAPPLPQFVSLEGAVDGADGREFGVLLLPTSIKDLDRDGRVGLDPGHDEPFLLRGEVARHPAVPARLGMQRGKAPVLIGIPPVFERPAGHRMGRVARR